MTMSSAPEAKNTAAAKAPGSNQRSAARDNRGMGKRSTKPDNGKARSKSPRRKRVNQQGNRSCRYGYRWSSSTYRRCEHEQQKPEHNGNKRPGQWKRGEGKMCRATDAKPYAAAPKPAPVAAVQPTNILLTKTIPLQNCKLLHWKSPHPHVPLAIEQTILEYLFVTSPKREGLLLRDEPNSDSRYLKITQACRQYNMPVSSALSLRQETVHWKNKNPNLRPAGFDSKVRKSAELFEVAWSNSMMDIQGQGAVTGLRILDRR
jgi:hypothetical protein